MKYYTETIPYDLYLKFSDAIGQFEKAPTYAEVLDWFMEREIFVNAYPERVAAAGGEYIYMYRPFVNGWIGKESDRTSWHEAANAAIEQAFTLI